MSLCSLVKSPNPNFSVGLYVLEDCCKVLTQILFFSRLSRLSFLSVFTEGCYSSLIIIVALLWTCSNSSMSFLCCGVLKLNSTSGRVTREQNREELLPPSAYLSHFFCCGLGYTWLFQLQVHTAGSYSVIYSLTTPSPQLEYSLSTHCPACICACTWPL